LKEFKDQKPTTHKAHRCSQDETPLRASLSRVEANHLEGDLLALEAATTAAAATTTESTAATTTVTEATTSATASTATEAAASTATEAAATATTATTEATTTATVVVAGLGIVKTDLATLNRLAIQLLESLLGIVDRGEANVAETLRATRLTREG
jgi:hypothetical protein